MNFDEITIDQLRNSGSLKWSTFPNTIGMFVAEMDLGIAQPIQDVLRSYAASPGIGYRSAQAKRELQEATAGWLSSHTDFRPNPDLIYAVPDVVSSARIVIDQLTDPGTPVILPTPAYMSFCELVPSMGRELIEVPCQIVNGRYELDLDGIRAGFAAGAQILLLVNPANPTGRVFELSELQELSAVVAEFPDAYVFSDDIHAPLLLDGQHIPYASVNAQAAAHTVTAVAASKGWSIPGLKCAQLVLTNPDHVALLEQYLSWGGTIASTVGASAAIAAYTECADWHENVLDYLRGNRDLVEETVASWPGVSMMHVEGTYIAWLDFTGAVNAGVIEGVPAQWLRENAGVALTPGSTCGHGYESFGRMIFATPRPVLRRALDQMSAALGLGDR